jgi:hypothetical protein
VQAEAAAEFKKQNCREKLSRMARLSIVPNRVRFYDCGRLECRRLAAHMRRFVVRRN